ncbi:glycerol-3-phosphate dehydrogenase subunit GlpB [Desulfovibrio ferrophilus]|uniref:Glycerol-3-phosphate dehydrogenase, anaerobic, B subunit n=1 Tax=Desulfovibrio ferrophilus TaxID=241368 RepID=A0A2Z6B194_9BACT|nr:glycerol-3-phosphate dehydrogenase subunit GlpB [Desulfovibrio ferrophilus]BBD09235.1 glycerol-3-phosphate dehydrogenase, anaerobic, B subunit [Desulfovibrio ferrophilus]
MSNTETSYDLMVIGAGMAGMAAALFASSRGLSVGLAGSVGGIDFSTGLIDLMAVHPLKDQRLWDDPWACIQALRGHSPQHPYALLEPESMSRAIDEFCSFLADMGMPMEGHTHKNTRILTAMGTAKHTFRAPRSMWAGAEALRSKAPCLLVDFHGLKGFSAAQIREVAGADWPGLRTKRIDFPGWKEELYPDHMATALHAPELRRILAEAVRPHLKGEQFVGFPALLGREQAEAVRADLEDLLGTRIFEIPTMPPSLAGSRLRAAFDRGLPPRGVRLYSQRMVLSQEALNDGGFRLRLGKERPETTIRAKAVILGTGRFFGKGLVAERGQIREPVFGLPVHQPVKREYWHSQDFYDPQGHELNQAGIETDSSLRPLDEHGKAAHPHLFATGSILAHQDWMRQKCGAGLAITTALKAVESAHDCLRTAPLSRDTTKETSSDMAELGKAVKA